MAHEWRKNSGSYVTGVLLVLGILNAVNALSQSQGSASTIDYVINEASPSVRIRITSSTTVYVVNVEPPGGAQGRNWKWKVSLELLALQLCETSQGHGGDKLKVVYSDPTSIKSQIWKLNASYKSFEEGIDPEPREVDNIQANQIVLLPEGRWRLSAADLIASLYQDPVDGECTQDLFSCSCGGDATSSEAIRCISKSLLCDGHPNCGVGCRDDEDKSGCSGRTPPNFQDSTTFSSCQPPGENLRTTENPAGSTGGTVSFPPQVTPVFILAIAAISNKLFF